VWACALPRPSSPSAAQAHAPRRLPPARAHRCPDSGKRRAPRGERMPATPARWRPIAPTSARARPYNLPRSASPFSFPSFRLAFSRAQLTPPHAEPLAGVSNSVRSSLPSATTPRYEHRFALPHSLLESARRGKLSRRRNGSPKFGCCSQSALHHGARPSVLPLASCLSAPALHHLTGARELFPAP
jgi:hypothetical protein